MDFKREYYRLISRVCETWWRRTPPTPARAGIRVSTAAYAYPRTADPSASAGAATTRESTARKVRRFVVLCLLFFFTTYLTDHAIAGALRGMEHGAAHGERRVLLVVDQQWVFLSTLRVDTLVNPPADPFFSPTRVLLSEDFVQL